MNEVPTTVYRSSCAEHGMTGGRRIFVYMTKGVVDINDQTLFSEEQARIDIEEPLLLKAKESAEFIMIDVPSCKGWGYHADTLRGNKK